MKQKRSFLSALPVLLLAAVLVVAVLAGGGFAKYRTEVLQTGEVSYQSQLVTGFTLEQYQLHQNADGSYTRSSETSTEQQSFVLIPGTTIPQAPFLTVTGRTEVAAVLYLEIKPCRAVRFSAAEGWTGLEGLTGPNGGSVYVWQGGANLEPDPENDPLVIPVLRDGFHVEENATAEGTVSMAGYLIQPGEGYTPEQAAELFRDRIPQEAENP